MIWKNLFGTIILTLSYSLLFTEPIEAKLECFQLMKVNLNSVQKKESTFKEFEKMPTTIHRLREDCTFNKDEKYIGDNSNCKQHKLLLVKKENSPSQYVLLAVTRRGNRVRAFTVPSITNETRVYPDHHAFHHYSTYAPSGAVIEDIFTIANRLFISTIEKHAIVVLYHVDVSFKNGNMAMKIQSNHPYRISPTLVRPAPHYMTYVSEYFYADTYAIGGILQVIYKEKNSETKRKMPDHTSVPLRTVFNGFGRAVFIENAPKPPELSYSTYLNVTEDFFDCLKTFNSILAYKLIGKENIQEKRYIAKSHPSKREAYPLVAMEFKKLKEERNNTHYAGAIVVFTLLALSVGTIWGLSFFLHWRQKRQRMHLDQSTTHSKTEGAKKP